MQPMTPIVPVAHRMATAVPTQIVPARMPTAPFLRGEETRARGTAYGMKRNAAVRCSGFTLR